MIEIMIGKFIAAAIIGYLLGSIPTGAFIARKVARVDVREYGSGKTGTTNVLRVAGKKAAALVVALDILKGTAAVLIAGMIIGDEYLVYGKFGFGLMTAQVLAALAAMAGHNWPIFLNFRGGRGVATFFGGLAGLYPPLAIFGGEFVVLGAGLTRFASLGSIAGVIGTYSILVPLVVFNGFPIEYLIYALIGGIAIIVMHRDNISRLVSGKERKLGQKAEQVDLPQSEKRAG